MRIHILGIGGTFMAGLACLAKAAGHEVVGSDQELYPPMSIQLQEQGIPVFQGYMPSYIDASVDCVIVGNVISRGNEAIEYVLRQKIPYMSGPQWLAENLLQKRWVCAVAGTHGKTTTTSLLTWILEYAGYNPGFLIGGIPENFGISAHMNDSPYFVIEADEYDSAFFDKRPKFMHYHPKTLILNNLEFDHADIFSDLAAIEQQFHYLVRTVPSDGNIIYNHNEPRLQSVLDKGCWSALTTFGNNNSHWKAKLLNEEGSHFEVFYQDVCLGEVQWNLLGNHNIENALAALAAANTLNVQPSKALEALPLFKNVKRRLEVKGKKEGIMLYDDFAHHPTAIAKTLAGLRAKVKKERIIVVLEFGSFTMRTGVHKHALQQALALADIVLCKKPAQNWGLEEILDGFSKPTGLFDTVDALIQNLIKQLLTGDHVVVMSNSGFGGIHQKILDSIGIS